jgi:hydroxymethylpyrimidine/phosphomethylpyrimidine kinase
LSTTETPPVALTIAGSDPGGGAGIQADLKVFAALGVYGTSVITALTSQNTLCVSDIVAVPASSIRSQFRALKEDLGHAAVKTGMLHSAETAALAAHLLGRPPMPLVVDPVLASSSGEALMDDQGLEVYRSQLIPLALILTPNLDEARRLLGCGPIGSAAAMRQACLELMELGCRSVYLKGGHLEGDTCLDMFYDGEFLELPAPRIQTRNSHGTGCTLSAALTANVAKGIGIRDSARLAKAYVTRALMGALHWQLGKGKGPLNHFPASQPPQT